MLDTKTGTQSNAIARSRPRLAAAFLFAIAVLAAGTACGGGPEVATAFKPTATVQDIMLSIVDPSADGIWESVATIVTLDGVEELRPRTDEEWARVRIDAIRLVESANLLLVEGRQVAAPGFRSENPGIELNPEEIQELIDEDQDKWTRLVEDLYEASLGVLKAVDARDGDMLFDSGEPLDGACESCHREYRYPEDHPTLLGSAGAPTTPPAADTPVALADDGLTGTIEGHVRLSGALPGNAVIRMGVDPLCSQLNEGTQVVQEKVVATRDGSLANAFVRLEGGFRHMPIPDEPVVIDQRHCIFAPRVVGGRAGQLVQLKNSDPLLHNLHALSTTTNGFNVGQPMEGMVHEVRLDEEQGMLRIQCDVHRWMTEFIGVVPHPYFAVTDLTGTFVIADVPVGSHTIQVWHEEFGLLTQTVKVEAGGVHAADFAYPGSTT